jgi:thiamine-phosphate pyrophosphorylase
MVRSAGALFIVNDRPDIALLANADGVHLGQDDMPVREARRLLGPDALIGVSTHDLDQVRRSVLEGASYLGVGPTFPSQTKEFQGFPGLEFVKQVTAETAMPAFVLGGVTAANLHEVLAVGGTRVAVSHAICAAEDPRAVTWQMRNLLEGK